MNAFRNRAMLAHDFVAASDRKAWQSFEGPRLVARPTLDWETAGAVTDWSDCILAIAARRDRQCFADLFLHFGPRLKSFFLRLGVSPGQAEDLVQETMLTVWRKAGQFDPTRAGAATWIFTVARNLRIDLKRRERDPALLAELYDGPAEPLPSDMVIAAEHGRRVRQAMAELPAEQVEVIRLSFFEDRPHGEIAALLGIPLGTVKSRARLAMARLRALAEGWQ
jgi:RNA polymerase sigma-70 factor (ECF subfamily)